MAPERWNANNVVGDVVVGVVVASYLSFLSSIYTLSDLAAKSIRSICLEHASIILWIHKEKVQSNALVHELFSPVIRCGSFQKTTPRQTLQRHFPSSKET